MKQGFYELLLLSVGKLPAAKLRWINGMTKAHATTESSLSCCGESCLPAFFCAIKSHGKQCLREAVAIWLGCQSIAVPVPICELVAPAFGTDWNEAAAVTKRMTEQSQQTQPPSAKGGCPIRSWQEKDDLTSVCVKLQHKPGAHKSISLRC